MSGAQATIMKQQQRSRLAYALDRLLYALKPFMRAYPMAAGDKMPEHDLVWVTAQWADIGSDPRQVIVNALKANPELWLHAVPPEVCIVPRKELEAVMKLNPSTIALLAFAAEDIIAKHAAKHSHEMTSG